MTQPTLHTAFTVPDSVLFRELDGEAVLLNLESGQYFGLNEVGTRIWQVLAEQGTGRAVVDALVAEFDVTAAQLEADTITLLEQLAAQGLIAAKP